MVDETSNDNFPVRGDVAARGADAHGQAALLLVESLIHSLVARSALTTAEAVDTVRIAADARIELAESTGEAQATLQRSIVLLDAIAASLEIDQPRV